MKKLVKPLLCGMAVMVLASGCAKKQGDGDTSQAESPTETSADSSSEAETEADLGEITVLGEYKGLEVTRMSTDVSDEELEERIQSILDANPEYVAVTDRAAKDGDILDIDYEGKKDGVAFDGGTAQGYKLELGSDTFIDGFEDGLIGAKAGEKRSLNLTFPEQYGSQELAGKAVVFDVTVNGIEEKRDAVLDLNFVQRMTDFNSVDEFRADTLADLELEKMEMAEQQLGNDVFIAATDNSQFRLNEKLVEEQYENQISYLTAMAQIYGMTIEDYAAMSDMTKEEMEKEIRNNVETSMKVQLLVKAIAEKENLQVEDADREEVARMNFTTVEELQEMYGETAVDNAAMSNKVEAFLKDNASIK
ncbi:trigger factor [Clostridiaceae bacterium]|nr:trigger factor [Clostridiaceae bacterium]